MTLMPGAGEGYAGEQYAGAPPLPDVSSSAYYLSLVTSEYQTSPKMLSWLQANLQLLTDALDCLALFPTAFDLDWAAGPQLDILGAIIGEPRMVAFQPSNGVSPVLDDATYRFLLKAHVFWNHWDGQLASILAFWRLVFPGGTMMFSDHQDMSITVYVAGAFTSIITDLISHGYILPRPQGVLLNFVFPTLPMLGFDRDDDYVSGLDKGHFT
ncbi:MAG TPA: DUF2612 domain-containing protein [Polyangia bacterium]|jgi:Protein of unknown function (DUF2612).|nr:DUF2612 domain-containing protein [Polyangia bacterium]